MVFTRRLSYAAPIVRVEKQNKIGMERNMTGQHRMIEIAHRRRTEVRCPTCGSFTFSVQDRHFNRMRRFPLLACKVVAIRRLAFTIFYFVIDIPEKHSSFTSIIIIFLFLGERATIKIST